MFEKISEALMSTGLFDEMPVGKYRVLVGEIIAFIRETNDEEYYSKTANENKWEEEIPPAMGEIQSPPVRDLGGIDFQ